MTVMHDHAHRGWSSGSSHGAQTLHDKYEVMKEIGDGSFGSVDLARVRSSASHVARRGTLVAIKTMKKTFESFTPCLELREIIFLRSLPAHQHLVPALDIFLDPLTKKLHIAMEYMDGNLYQLMKARDLKCFDGNSVKSILFQILSGLEHIHNNGFFHRDIKPENILVTVSAREDYGGAFKRYSQLVTPPSTPPSYSIKIADFGLARETGSKLPYTTYVSTRWYRAPEVLLRAGEYSAPVDVWAVGAMAVEIATLKPLFPGGNEVDQVWRICEMMGSPGNWINKEGAKVGGGDWKDGVKLAQKLGFSFPKMAPHTLDTVLPQPQWPASLTHFVTWCLAWDPKSRPTCAQAMAHEYFIDAVDPLRPKSSGAKLLSRKHSSFYDAAGTDAGQSLSSKTSSWFRRSLIRDNSAPQVPHVQHEQVAQPLAPTKQDSSIPQPPDSHKTKPTATKRNTWATAQSNNAAAPMPILPSIKPISPLSNAVTAQAQGTPQVPAGQYQQSPHGNSQQRPSKKIGRQLSQASQGNHYADSHRQEAEKALTGQSGLMSPTNGTKESFFSHLRKRARRLSGRNQATLSPKYDDLEANVGSPQYTGARNSTNDNAPNQGYASGSTHNFSELDQALQSVRYSMDAAAANANANANGNTAQPGPNRTAQKSASNPALKRHHSLQHAHVSSNPSPSASTGLHPQRSTRRAAQKPTLGSHQYDTPDEQEELLDEALNSAQNVLMQLDHQPPSQSHHNQSTPQHAHTRPRAQQLAGEPVPYPTPSPSAKRNSVNFDNAGQNSQQLPKPIDIHQVKQPPHGTAFPFPTPPEENEWAAAAAASLGLGEQWRR